MDHEDSQVIDRVAPLLVGSLSLACFAAAMGVGTGRADEPAKSAPALNFKVQDIDGKTVDLAGTYQGKVLLVVNTASQHGSGDSSLFSSALSFLNQNQVRDPRCYVWTVQMS